MEGDEWYPLSFRASGQGDGRRLEILIGACDVGEDKLIRSVLEVAGRGSEVRNCEYQCA